MKYEELPKHIQERMLDCQEEEGDDRHSRVFIENIFSGFEFDGTLEGVDYWQGVCESKSIEDLPEIPEGCKYLYGLPEKLETYDYINSPEHHRLNSMETWDLMIQIWGRDKFISFCEMNAFKYRIRAGKKPGESTEKDIKKALVYENKIKEINNGDKQ